MAAYLLSQRTLLERHWGQIRSRLALKKPVHACPQRMQA
jgi:hypothetical protein